MAYQHRTISIPIRDSTEDVENVKRLRRFSIEVWNLTQNWITVSVKASNVIERIVNHRLQIMYARFNTQSNDEKTVEGTEDTAKLSLTEDEKKQHQMLIIVALGELEECMDDMNRIIDKIRTALSRIPPWKKLIPSPGPICGNILDTLESTLPDVINMYDMELSARRAALSDISQYEHRHVFTAALLTFKFEPFFDPNLVSRLYSLVVLE